MLEPCRLPVEWLTRGIGLRGHLAPQEHRPGQSSLSVRVGGVEAKFLQLFNIKGSREVMDEVGFIDPRRPVMARFVGIAREDEHFSPWAAPGGEEFGITGSVEATHAVVATAVEHEVELTQVRGVEDIGLEPVDLDAGLAGAFAGEAESGGCEIDGGDIEAGTGEVHGVDAGAATQLQNTAGSQLAGLHQAFEFGGGASGFPGGAPTIAIRGIPAFNELGVQFRCRADKRGADQDSHQEGEKPFHSNLGGS